MNKLPLVFLLACGGHTSPVEHSGDCDEDVVHLWRVHAYADGLYTVRVDTVADATAFDPDAILYAVDSWSGNPDDVLATDVLGYGDDDFACTFPPPEYECPQMLASVEGATQDLLVVVGILGSCAGAEVEYELTVELDSQPVKVELVGEAAASRFVAD
ncbi:MAG: hypothetical protein KC656_00155 [Myxococcales bacterium]|nr:hypothetical protein [Myxococcales bacterium]MCB9672112.1 hypothetical protein [Alphaproteobacteria bacterium]MCB9691565.1 hypothetical protein [Alphaproteobacteria bacterium]